MAKTKRAHVRYRPEPGTYAEIDLDPDRDDFKPSTSGLVADESYRGCGVVMIASNELREGMKARVKVGKVQPLSAEVRWRVDLDHQVMKIGFMYLE